jgi:hypothetical protein
MLRKRQAVPGVPQRVYLILSPRSEKRRVASLQ